ncbi:hypothetical protein SAMN02745121_04992 [Nannocystis exedens]|uniref:Lysozyme inhibitor LprI N-terminal domain-containing protein n=1 Tax=Nannocystis exedens TaxID=54 RepID=A0A1I2CA57_9BACT|nr:hypothetical protein [Nannocystis exedens]PCC68438.1 hypothetical protein NAEX_01452 [Nannocystis exedens]SFE65078.1 hypothetical protein SAMN02745121_04992 [Nannocystis exedens]
MRTLAVVLVALAGCAPEAAGPTVTPLIAPAEPAPAARSPDEEPAPSDMTPPAAAPGGVEPSVGGPPGQAPSDMPEKTASSGHAPKDLPAYLPIGLPACDAYIARYAACEPRLKPEIMSGRRRAAVHEAGWLKYMHTEVKDPGLADACKQMLAELRTACDGPVKSP